MCVFLEQWNGRCVGCMANFSCSISADELMANGVSELAAELLLAADAVAVVEHAVRVPFLLDGQQTRVVRAPVPEIQIEKLKKKMDGDFP